MLKADFELYSQSRITHVCLGCYVIVAISLLNINFCCISLPISIHRVLRLKEFSGNSRVAQTNIEREIVT